MTSYELVFITANDDKNTQKKIEDIIEKHNGKITQKDSLGKKYFAYQINKLSSGHYYNWLVELDPLTIKDIKFKMNLETSMLRYLLLKV